VVDHGLAILPGLVEPPAFCKRPDQRVMGVDDQGGSLGKLPAEVHCLDPLVHGKAQLALSLVDTRQHLVCPYGKAGGFPGHGVLQ